MTMDPEAYQAGCISTCGAFDSTEEQLIFACALASGEAGELLNLAVKVHWQHHPLSAEMRRKLLEESGDVLWGLSVALDSIGLTLSDAMLHNQRKLAKRYPRARFTPEDSIARVDVEA